MKVLIEYTEGNKRYTFGIIKLFKELKLKTTKKQIIEAVKRVLERTA